MKFSRIKNNKNNPRFIKDENFEKLKVSIVQFPEMLRLRPIVIDDDGTALGGNMRYLALVDLRKTGFEEIYPESFSGQQIEYRRRAYASIRKGEFLDEWVVMAKDLTEDQKQEFIIKDNVPFGRWDDDLLANQFSDFPLTDWGLDFIPPTELDMDGFFQEAEKIEVPEKQTISLSYTTEEYNRVSPALLKHGKSYELALWNLLGL